jgi:hypothetical protein
VRKRSCRRLPGQVGNSPRLRTVISRGAGQEYLDSRHRHTWDNHRSRQFAVKQIGLKEGRLLEHATSWRFNHDNIHVRGYKEEGTITTPFDMTVLNDLDRFHLVMDAIDRLPQTGPAGVYLKQQLKDKLIEHKQYINKYGEDLPEIRHWKWDAPNACVKV